MSGRELSFYRKEIIEYFRVLVEDGREFDLIYTRTFEIEDKGRGNINEKVKFSFNKQDNNLPTNDYIYEDGKRVLPYDCGIKDSKVLKALKTLPEYVGRNIPELQTI
jgi:hypothetical protein